jgi:hypothetical protein
LAAEREMPKIGELPLVSLAQMNRYNKSKLNIKDQWASHPSTEERIAQAERLNLPSLSENLASANTLFRNIENTQCRMTAQLFEHVDTFLKTVTYHNTEEFVSAFETEYKNNTFPLIFNAYFDDKNPALLDILKLAALPEKMELTPNDIFGEAAVDTVYTIISLEQDIETLTDISQNQYEHIKSFDYNGIKYTPQNLYQLIPSLKNELHLLKLEIEKNDANIFQYCLYIARQQDKGHAYQNHYQAYLDMDKTYDAMVEDYEKVRQASNFVHETLPHDVILQRQLMFRNAERDFKKLIEKMRQEPVLKDAISPKQQDVLNVYMTRDWVYFLNDEYSDHNLGVLFDAMRAYNQVLSQAFFQQKKRFLEFQAKLII